MLHVHTYSSHAPHTLRRLSSPAKAACTAVSLTNKWAAIATGYDWSNVRASSSLMVVDGH